LRACARALGASLLLGVVGMTGFVSVGAMLGMAPEPDPVPRRWQLDMDPGALRMATFDIPNIGPRRFFYMSYVVTNNSGQDLLFAPAFDMANGEGEVIRSGRDVPLMVTQKLLEQAKDVFIQDQIGIIGEIRQGQENAKHGLVIWPANDLRPNEVVVYVGGLSGETATVTSPDGKQKFVLRKTMKLDFQSPGDLTTQGAQALPLGAKSWIMR
jgi:hypothetical protein